MRPCVYILISIKDGKRYIGSTVNIERRLREHVGGHVKATSGRLPVYLYGVRYFEKIEMAATFEKKYKRSSGQLTRDIKNGKIILQQGIA